MHKHLLLLLTFLYTTYSNAQDWYTQYQITQTVSTSENMSGTDIFLTYPGFTFSVGNNFGRVLGMRLSGGIWPQCGHAGKQLEKTFPDLYKRYRFCTVGGYADLMVNLTELCFEKDPDRTQSMYFLAGGGYVHTFGFDKKVETDEWTKYYPVNTKPSNYPVVHLGLGGLFKLSKAVDLTVEAKYNFINDKYNGVDRGAFTDGYFDLGVGINWYFSHKHIHRADYPYIPDDLVRTERFKAGERMNTCIYFYFEYETIPTEQYIYIKNVVEFLNKQKDAKLVIHGYPDKNYKDSYRQERNSKLAQDRAEGVRNMLIKKYGIAPSRLTVESHPTPKSGYKQKDGLNLGVEFEMKK